MPTGWVANLLMDGRLINYAAGDSRIKQGTATLPRSAGVRAAQAQL
ncbi:hypothetical protein PEC18_03435 [Paucibacter sp. O1-1]|nr:hypothetical protein [Paucibacter sp. O1-1]MDA3824930.1 hypothetical protein [Paucibacter sp. O1-1]